MLWLNTQLHAQTISQHKPTPHPQQVQPAPAPKQVQPAPARKAVRVPAPGPQMQVPARVNPPRAELLGISAPLCSSVVPSVTS